MDDEHPCLDELVYLLSKQGNVEIAGAYIDPLVALEASADLKAVGSILKPVSESKLIELLQRMAVYI